MNEAGMILRPRIDQPAMEFRMVTEEDYSSVIDHLRASFFEDEPLNKAVQLCPAGAGHQELERQCVETMMDGYSIVAVLDGEIVGAALNGVLRPGDTAKSLEKLRTMDDEKFRKIFTLLYSVTEKLDLFNRYQVDSILECRIMSVGSKARGKGLAGELLKRSINLARSSGYKLFKGDATGKFSQRICEKNGLETLKELYYHDYLDPRSGLPVFEVPAPHETLKIMILKL